MDLECANPVEIRARVARCLLCATNPALRAALADSNSTRTESYVAIHFGPEARAIQTPLKAVDSKRIQTDHPSELGDGGGSENPGFGGSIPSQPTIFLLYLPHIPS